MVPNVVSSQVIDTIANWDGINVEWSVYGATGQLVDNPDQLGVNPSANCFEITTSEDPYDFMYTDFSAPINFTEFPIYRLKILAPASGGSVLLKFENSNNSSWHEIELTPIPGQWDDLEFDFSGTTATDFVRMVIFLDFQGNTADNLWYVDDVLRVSSGNTGLTSNLPIVIINTYGIEIPDEPKIDGFMGIIDNGIGNMNNQYDLPNDYNGYIGIEVRGQSSQMFPKKSYGFETRDEQGENFNVPLLGMPEENDWILYAPYSDKSMLRNFITFYMGSKLDPYCTRVAFCEVIVNNDYKGVYILMEKIKKDENRVSIATLNPEDITGDELTGGYIVKVDKIDPGFVYGVDGWKSIPNPVYPDAMNITFQFYYPSAEDIVSQQRNYIQDYILFTENAMTFPSFTDPNIGYNKYLNSGSFVDQMLLNEISKEVDNYRYSTYFYKEKDSDGGKLFAGPAWDFNLGYANVDYWPPGIDHTGWLYSMVEPVDWGIMFWWKRLMEDTYFRNLAKTRWEPLRQNELSNDNLVYAIDSIVAYIDEAQQRNYERWPILGTYVWPNYYWQGNTYNGEVAFFKNWFFNRLYGWISIPGTVLYPGCRIIRSLT
ncbi:MAG: CotH kinase family protein [Bacteroidales bacterium]